MESFLYYRFYSFNLNNLLDACIVEIPVPWQIERGYFAESTLYLQEILARIMLMEMINNAFTPFDPAKASIVDEKLTYEGLSISVSYSGDLILVTASAKFVVGVDVEEIRSRDMSLFQKVFRPEEWKWIDNAWHTWEAFYELWTRKERL
jgi:phosphopantetheinyl transferase